jgi:hypothetical protein
MRCSVLVNHIDSYVAHRTVGNPIQILMPCNVAALGLKAIGLTYEKLGIRPLFIDK